MRELGLDVGELRLDDVDDARARGEDGQIFLDLLAELLQLVADLVAAERGQALQAQIEDGARLLVGKADGAAGVDAWRGSAISSTSGPMSLAGQSRAIICSRASAGLGALRISRIISSILATATARPTNTCARSRDLASKCLVRRLTTSSRKAVKAAMKSFRFSCSGRPPLIASMLAPKRRLQVRVAPQLVEHHVGNGVALQLDDDAHAFAVGFVPDVGDAFDALLAHLLGNLLDQRRAC